METKDSNMHIAIVAEGGSDAGLGHLYRGSRLARSLLMRGHQVTGVTSSTDKMGQIFPSKINIVELVDGGWICELSEWIESAGSSVDVIIVDKPSLPLEQQCDLHRLDPTTVFFFDTSQQPVCCDVVVNGHVYADEAEYKVVGEEPRWCTGGQYLILPEDVRKLAGQSIPWRDPPERALVLMGGSDPLNTTPTAIRAFQAIDINVTVVIGPGFDNESETRSAVEDIDTSVTTVKDPSNLAELMFEADLAVTALGLTAYELMALQTPFVGLPQASDQQPKAKALKSEDCAIILDSEATAMEIGNAISRLVEEPETRKTYRARCQNIVPQDGTDQVCEVIERVA